MAVCAERDPIEVGPEAASASLLAARPGGRDPGGRHEPLEREEIAVAEEA